MHKLDALILFSNSFINCARFHPLLDSFEGHQSMLRRREEVHICLTLENRAGGYLRIVFTNSYKLLYIRIAPFLDFMTFENIICLSQLSFNHSFIFHRFPKIQH